MNVEDRNGKTRKEELDIDKIIADRAERYQAWRNRPVLERLMDLMTYKEADEALSRFR